MSDQAVHAPELAGLFVEKPAFFLGGFDNATSQKRTAVLIGGCTSAEPIKEISTHITLNSTQYSQHLCLSMRKASPARLFL